MLASLNMIIFLKIWSMISNFKLFPNFNISQNFVQNVQKQKNTFVPELFASNEPNFPVLNFLPLYPLLTLHSRHTGEDPGFV